MLLSQRILTRRMQASRGIGKSLRISRHWIRQHKRITICKSAMLVFGETVSRRFKNVGFDELNARFSFSSTIRVLHTLPPLAHLPPANSITLAM